jgi:hypothetical protein
LRFVLRSGGRLVIYVTSRKTMEKWPFAGPGTHRTFDYGTSVGFSSMPDFTDHT